MILDCKRVCAIWLSIVGLDGARSLCGCRIECLGADLSLNSSGCRQRVACLLIGNSGAGAAVAVVWPVAVGRSAAARATIVDGEGDVYLFAGVARVATAAG